MKIKPTKFGICLICGKNTDNWWYFNRATNECKCRDCMPDRYSGRQLDIFEELDLSPVLTIRGGSSTTPSIKKKKVLPLWKREINRMMGCVASD